MNKAQSQLQGDDVKAGLTPELWDELKQAQPQDDIDPQFQASLRSRLEQAARRTKIESQSIKEPIHMSLSKYFLGVGTALVAVAIIWYVAGGQQFSSPKSTVEVLSSEYGVTDVAANSFGSLANLSGADQGGRGAGGDSAAPLGSETALSANPVGVGGYGGGGTDAKIIAPYPTYDYTFDYVGGDLPALDAQQAVFQRIKGTLTNPTSSIMGAIRLGLFNIQKLVAPNIENLSISEDRDFGYTANLNFIEGSVSLYENWRKWALPERQCRDDACYNQYRMKPEDMPTDDVIIATANKFLVDYSVNTANYGQPQVQDYWRREYAAATDKSTIYIPDVVNVVYPYVIEGKSVYEESGTPAGLNVSVNVKHSVVSSVYEITTQQYNKSGYAGFTNQQEIIKYAEKGGFRNYNYIAYAGGGATVKKVTLKLDTPTVGMMRFWKYSETDGGSEELYVPALIFPITNKAEAQYYRDAIIVPLVKEVIDSDTQPPIIPLERSVEVQTDLPAVEAPVTN